MGRLIIFLGFLITPVLFSAQTGIDGCIPNKVQGQFVYDAADLLTESEELSIQRTLRSFTDSTSNVIVVITHLDFCGYEPSTFAIEAGDRLGVGRSDLDNGVVMAIKPRNNGERGQFFIATGEGLEGAIPDVLTGRIVNQMIPDFKLANWRGGIEIGLNQIMGLATGEFTEEDYMQRGGDELPAFFVLIFLFFFFMPPIVIMIAVRNLMKKDDTALGTAIAIVLANMNKRNNSYNNFKRGRGSFGGGGGFRSGSSGFGGFGGGSFGGGGAGGSF